MKESKIIGPIRSLGAMQADLDEIEALFRKRKGRNPLAICRIRNEIAKANASLVALLLVDLAQERRGSSPRTVEKLEAVEPDV